MVYYIIEIILLKIQFDRFFRYIERKNPDEFFKGYVRQLQNIEMKFETKFETKLKSKFKNKIEV